MALFNMTMTTDRLLPEDSVVVIVPTPYGDFKAPIPTKVSVDGLDYIDFQLIEIDWRGGMQCLSYFLGRKAKSKEQLAAEEAVKKAEQSLEAAKKTLQQIKEKQ